MSLQDQVTQDQANVDADQTKLATDTATLSTDTAKLAAVQPHLDLVERVRAEIATIVADLTDTAAQIEATVNPLLDQLRDLILSA